MSNESLPIMCTLSSSELRERSEALLPGLARQATTTEPAANGYCFTFPATSAMLQAITRVIDAERQCCRFLEFQLTVPANHEPIRLVATGPAGTREMLQELLSTC